MFTDGGGSLDTFLGRALTDPATGLPNLPYFFLIQDWEERRAKRRGTHVRVISLHVTGGDDESRRALLLRLCQELRTSDLIASDGGGEYRILLTTPDAENSDAIAERVRSMAASVNGARHNGNDGQSGEGGAVTLTVILEAERVPPPDKGPCEPCEEHELLRKTSGSGIPGLTPDD